MQRRLTEFARSHVLVLVMLYGACHRLEFSLLSS